MQEIRPLTSLRGLAALWVVFFHLFSTLSAAPHASIVRRVIDRGYLAVDIFFVLSGFVMGLTYRALFASMRGNAYPSFLVHRIARVMPLNAAIVLAIAGVIWAFPHDPGTSFALAERPGVVLANLLLIQDWGLTPSIDRPAWSVSVEMAVYFVFPLLLRLVWSRFWPLVALAGIATVVWLISIGQGQISRGFVPNDFMGLAGGDFVRGFTEFYFGLLCYRGFCIPAVRNLAEGAEPAVVIAFVLLVAFSPTDLAPLAVCPFLVLAVASGRGRLSRCLGTPPLYYLGAISYSIYLIHYCVMGVVNALPIPPGLTRDGLTILVTLLISAATYRLIERPARAWLRRLASINP